ncbi:MAG: hypothetical protein KY444_12095, partial [Gemmatimonadetes bacterium]|nr:hypothetical protein [Gemmatimonadota bacterium]
TREQLGGFYLIEARDLNEGRRWAWRRSTRCWPAESWPATTWPTRRAGSRAANSAARRRHA